MKENKLSFLSGSLLWFGAAISIAEIITGTFLAPLGFGKGMLAIILGHLIGCVLFYYTGLIGAKSKMTAMESVSLSFGRPGSVFFSIINVLQLVGWTAVMIISGANAFGTVVNGPLNLSNNLIWCLLIGALNVIWIIVDLKNIGKINNIAVAALLILTVVLGFTVFHGGAPVKSSEVMSFGLALELSIAMPISWLPLISDYTKNTDEPVRFTLISTVSYFVGSSFMYAIGLGAAYYAGNSDVVQILKSAGLGVAAMFIILLSTITTSYLDVYSAAESVHNIYSKWNKKMIGIGVCFFGTVIAIFTPIEQYQNFLYLIGSVFVPMATILILDYFILHKRENTKGQSIINAILWVIGFVVYRIFIDKEVKFGSTIPVIVIVFILSMLINLFINILLKNRKGR